MHCTISIDLGIRELCRKKWAFPSISHLKVTSPFIWSTFKYKCNSVSGIQGVCVRGFLLYLSTFTTRVYGLKKSAPLSCYLIRCVRQAYLYVFLCFFPNGNCDMSAAAASRRVMKVAKPTVNLILSPPFSEKGYSGR